MYLVQKPRKFVDKDARKSLSCRRPRSAAFLLALLCALLSPLFLCSESQAQATSVRSIREWVVGDGKTDDALATAKAFSACRNNQFTLLVDCPVYIHIGSDITRPIFIDSGTDVQFTSNGLFIVDDVFEPAFVMANSTNINLQGWTVEYVGGLPVNETMGGYYNAGKFVSVKGGYAEPAFAFNDLTLKHWLTLHRNIDFTNGTSAIWQGPTSTSSMFMAVGSTNNVSITNFFAYAPQSSGGNKFIPMVFNFGMGYTSNQTVAQKANTDDDWITIPNLSIPYNFHFNNVKLDGYYMGFQGALQNSSFMNISAGRYGDLQDASGGNVGGIGKWFAPPHLFYVKYVVADYPYDPRLSVRNVHISRVHDAGTRIGTARDFPGSPGSGYANSLKFGGVSSSVMDYTSNRPDGLADILSCYSMTLTDVVGTYSSSFLNDLYPGVRFPANGFYQHLNIRSLHLTDTSSNPYSTYTGASTGTAMPFSGNNGNNPNMALNFTNVTVNLNQWTRPYALQPNFKGSGMNTTIKFNLKQ